MKITLRAARVNAGLSLKDVSKNLKTSYVTVSRWETGKSVPSIKKFKQLCALYGIEEDMIAI